MSKKISVLVALLLMAGATLSAQNDTNNVVAPHKVTKRTAKGDGTFSSSVFPRDVISHWSLGLFGGGTRNSHDVDVSYATDMKYTQLPGKTAGISAAYYPIGWFGFRADAAFVQKNYRMDRDNRSLPFVYTESTNSYLSLPVAAEISFGRTFRVSAFAGGYVGYWLSGHREGQSLSVSYLLRNDEATTYFDQSYIFDDRRDNRFDAGVLYGVAARVAILGKVDVSAEVRWYYGLTDVQKAYMRQLNPRYNTTLAFQFGLSWWL